ncbi:MAG: hypothetical protein F6K56_08920, partial [Moorea sp. SIO3G5]|nr:hypothetical protein [Moorena sp. SIO3G5]
VGLVRAGFSGDYAKDSKRRPLGMMGIEGLAKMRQHKTINRLIEQHEIDLEQAQGFLLQWINRDFGAGTSEQGAGNMASKITTIHLESL